VTAPPIGSAADVWPSASDFAVPYKAGVAQVVWTRLIADLETPVSAYMKLAGKPGMSFLLESVEGGAARGRYSVIGLEPDLVWRTKADKAEMGFVTASTTTFKPEQQPALTSLRTLLTASRLDLPPELPPMAAGVFGYMGYDTIRLVEHLPDINQDDLGVPDSILIRPTIIVIFDSVRDELSIVTPVRPSAGVTAETAYAAALQRLSSVVESLKQPIAHPAASATTTIGSLPEPVSNTTALEFRQMVDTAKDYIRAGDIFQVVLSQRFSTPFTLPAFTLYRSLRRLNPSPYLFYLDFDGFALVGSSPEILVRVRDGQVTIRPIAGTARRGTTDQEDRALGEALLRDPKERAEHLMLLDLGRNDVGRVAKTGTVEVTDQFVVERYSHVMHIVSNVIGQLDSPHDAVDALMAGFPAGTVSGAPKVRAMQVIDELEKSKRSPYAGCVGYFTADGEMDTAIVLRTALVKDGVLYVQSGAGIVYDSIAENEQQECINKAKAIVRAAEDAVRIAGARRSDTSDNGGAFN
jgi:anthranilate synthase component I